MEAAPNRHRTALHSEPLQDGPLTPRQRAIADAVRNCHSLADFYAAPAETVTAITIAKIPLNMPDELVERNVREGIVAARKQLDRIEGMLAMYGASAFAPRPEPVHVPLLSRETTRHGIVTTLLRYLSATGCVLVRAGDRPVTKDASGAYVVGEKGEPK